MTEQMQDHIEKLNKALDWAIAEAEYRARMLATGSCLGPLLDGAEHVEGLRLLRQDYGQMARARDEAIGMLTYLRDEHLAQPYCIGSRDQLAPRPEQYRLSLPDRNRITQIIALLEGAAEEGEDEAER